MKEDQKTDKKNQSLKNTNVNEDYREQFEAANNPECNHDLFYQELRVIAEDSGRED